MKYAVLFSLATFVLGGCDLLQAYRSSEGPSPAGVEDGAADGVELRVGGDAYAPGRSVELTLVNGSDRTAGHPPVACATLQREAKGEWASADEVVCIEILESLAPGASKTAPRALPEALPEGTYRFALPIHFQDGDVSLTATSEPFTVSVED